MEQAKRTIGKYEVLSVLGRGSMGIVYKARDPEIGRLVAIKTLRKFTVIPLAASQGVVEQFRSEARSAGSLRHPHIITVFEVGQDSSTPFIVMEYVEGKGLDSVIAHEHKLAPERTLRFLEQLAEAIDYAHKKGVFHRDIKPANILVDAFDRVCIVDFGVAHLAGAAQGRDSHALIMGSPGYMSPEQLRNEYIDSRADLFSLAVVLFECFTGRRPFPGDSASLVVSHILESPPLLVSDLCPELPVELDAIFDKALAKEREHRYSDAASLLRALQEVFVRNEPQQVVVGEASTEDLTDHEELAPHKEEDGQVPVELLASERLGKSFSRMALFSALVCGLAMLSSFMYRENGGLMQSWRAFANSFAARFDGGAESSPARIAVSLKKASPQMDNVELLTTIMSPGIAESRRISALREAGKRKVGGLAAVCVRLLSEPSPSLKLEALATIRSNKDSEVVDGVVKALSDSDENVRAAAALTLEQLGEKKVLPELVSKLTSEPSPVVKKALKKAIDTLADSLPGGGLPGTAGEVRWRSI